jgi:hypothetical protein
VFLVFVYSHDSLDGVLALRAQNVVSFSLDHELAFAALHLLLNFEVLGPPLALDVVDALLGIVVHVDAHLLNVLLSLLKLDALLLKLSFLLIFQNQPFTLTLCRFAEVFLFPSMFEQLV